jgi:hypothetical protein
VHQYPKPEGVRRLDSNDELERKEEGYHCGAGNTIVQEVIERKRHQRGKAEYAGGKLKLVFETREVINKKAKRSSATKDGRYFFQTGKEIERYNSEMHRERKQAHRVKYPLLEWENGLRPPNKIFQGLFYPVRFRFTAHANEKTYWLLPRRQTTDILLFFKACFY